MASGYLGKISAIVSANTADFDGKLSKSAKEVSSFARGVQSNLTSASRQAAKSLEGIYTPLQKFERSLQAAASMKLSFKGFPGMIKDLDGLQQRLNSVLSQRQVDIVLKTTGMSSVSALRDAISGLKSKDIEIITRFGGVDKLNELGGKIQADVDIGKSRENLANLTAAAEAAKAKVLAISSGAVTVTVNAESLDSLRAKADEARAAAGKLMGGEFMGDKSLSKSISATSSELVRLQSELDRATAARNTLATMASGPRSKPEELNAANARVSSLTGQQQELGKKLAELEKYRDTIKTVMREIKQAEAGGGAATSGSDMAAARKEQAAAIRAVSQAAKELQAQVATKYGVDIDLSDLDELMARGAKAGDVLERLPALMDALGRSDLEAASNKMRQLVSVSEQLSDPIKAAQATLTGLAKEVQAGFLPALVQSQSELESLNALIEDGIAPTAVIKKNFDQVKASVDATVASVRQLAEVSEKAGRVKTGRELVFSQPGLSGSLDRGAAVGSAAAGLPAAAISSNPRLVDSLVKINQLTREAEAAFAKLQMKANVGLPTGSAQRSLDLLVAKLNAAQDIAEKQIKVVLDTAEADRKAAELVAKLSQAREQTAFLVTGRPQNIGQADSRRSSIDSDVATLDRSQRQNVKPLLDAADVARSTGDIDKINDALDDLALKVAQEKRVNVDFEKAKKDSLDLKAKMDSLKDESAFVISANVQNAGQAEAEIKRIVSGMEQLDAAQRQALQPKVDAAISSLGMKDAKTGLPDIAAISAAVKDLDDEFVKEREIKVTKDEAQKSVEELKASLAGIADKIGDPSQPIDRLRKSVEAANAAIAKMPAGAIRTKLEGDLNAEKARIEAAAKPGAPTPTPGGIDAGAARVDAIAAAATAATPAKATANPLGADFGTAERSIASLQSNVSSLQSSLEKLPLPMQAQFIPAINEVRSEFQKLTIASTADEIDAVVTKAKSLEVAFTRAGQAAKFGGTLGEALNEAAITRTEKRLGFVRAKLLEVGATASGPVANAFNAYSAAAAAAAQAGTSGTAATTQQLDGLIAKIGEALVAEGKLTAAQGRAFSKNVGDVGRGGADKFSLAINQAAFAVDDFLSSTGGLEFKLRAISNNVTQLGFVIGGTAGLVTGLTAVIAGQAAIQLIKWANNGQSAEDQTKALNDALARQKSLVEELAQAFGSLGDAMSRGTFSAGGEQAQDFSRQLEEIKKKQVESRERTVIDIDPEVQRERANQNKLRKQLESETDIGSRTAIQAQIRASEDKERRRGGEAVASAPAGGREVSNAILRARDVVEFDRQRRTNADPSQFTPEEIARRRQEAVAGVMVNAGGGLGLQPGTLSDQRKALQRQIADLTDDATGFGPEATRAAEQRNNLESLLAGIELPLRIAIDELAVSIAEASRGPTARIRQAQEEVAEAIRRGVPNAAAFQSELDANAAKLKEAYATLEEAQKEKDLDGKTIDLDTRQAKVDEAKKSVDEVEAEQENIRNRSRELRLGRTFGGERATAALSSLQGNERFRNESAGQTAKLVAAIDAEIAAQSNLQVARESGSAAAIKAAEAELELAQRASEVAAALADAALSIESSLTRVRKVGDSALQRSEQGADAAQQDYTNSPLRAGAKEARDAAERRLINDRARVGNSQADLDNRRREIQQDPAVQRITREIESIRQRREDLTAKSQTAGGLNQAENKELTAATKQYIGLIQQLEQAALDLTDAQLKQKDAINLGIAAREKELEKSRQRASEPPSSFKQQMEDTDQIIADSERQAKEAEQRYINNPSFENIRGLRQARDRLGKDREQAQKFQESLEARRKENESDVFTQSNRKGIALNDERLASLAEKEANVGLDEDEKKERLSLQENNRTLRKSIDTRFDLFNPLPKDIRDARIEQNQRDRALRGRDLGLTDRERFRKEFREGAGADINARAAEMREAGENPNKFLQQAYRNQMEQVAPMLQGFQEERQNALLQGPSRAALNVSDVSTSQGASELTRLLRGDDSAKDVNLAELRKQSDKLDEVVKAIREANPGVLL
jgi:hypothetical protein